MVIGIDIRVLGTGRKSGIEEYTEQLLAHLIPLDPEIKYKLFYSAYSASLRGYPWLKLPNVSLYSFKIPNRILFYGSQFFGLPKLDRMMEGVDVMFSPHFFLAPVSQGVKRVITFHDLSFERFPDFFSWRRRIWHQLQMRPRLQAERADRIIAVSGSTLDDLVELYKIPREKISRIYSGISSSFIRSSNEDIDSFRKKHQLGPKFILSLGTFEPRKNITGLVSAFEIIKGREDFHDVQLVVAGSKGWLYQDILHSIRKSRYSRDIKLLEIEDDMERPLLYSSASLFVYPSFFEGFGFPPLEAMACGVPVVASNQSSLPETLKDAVILVDPYNISEIANAITGVLSDSGLAKHLVTRGEQQCKKFSWASTARETLQVLRFPLSD